MAMKIVLTDDHPIVLDGLERLFQLESDIEVVGRCRNGAEALGAVESTRPDVLVLDVAMPAPDGLSVLRQLHEQRSPVRVVLLTVALDDNQLLEAVRLGARGIVLKEMAPQILVAAVREVHSGGEWLEVGSVGRALRRLRQKPAPPETGLLTPRELEIVRLVGDGLRNRAIADKLCISEGTVKIHLHNIYEKVQVGGRLELVLYAQQKGLL